MPIINDSGNETIFLGNTPVVEVRLGGQLLWPTQVAKPPIEIVEIGSPVLNVSPVPEIRLPSISKESQDLLPALGIVSAVSLPQFSGIEIPCSGSTLPTRAEIVNEFNKLAQIPSKLKAYSIQEPDLDAEIQKQIDDMVANIEDTMEGIGDILSPHWKKGEIRNWQKEADDAWNELITDYHIYVPAKMLEMVSKLVPINFQVNVLGINVDVLRILEKGEQENIQQQIENQIDQYYNMLPQEYQSFNGDFGLICDEYKARVTWQYFKSEIVSLVTGLLHDSFGKLIDKFKEIWDTLGLPSLPDLLDFDVESFIRGQVDSAKQKAEQHKQDAIAKAESLEQEVNNFDLQSEAYGMVVDQLEGVSLFGMSLLDVIGGEIDETVKMAEKDIDNLVKSARDFAAQWDKKLLFDWVEKVKKFFNAIGLGKLMDIVVLTFCDVLPLIGIPTSFDVELPV